MELWLVYTLITAYMCRITWLVSRKTAFLERITRWRKERGLAKKVKKKKRARKDKCDLGNSKTDTGLENYSTRAKDETIKGSESKKREKDTKMDKDAKDKNKLAKNAVKKMNKENEGAPSSEKGAPKTSKIKTDKGNDTEFRKILARLSALILTDDEAAKVVAVLRAKNPSVLDARSMELKQKKLKAAGLEELLNDQQGAMERAQCNCKEMENIKMQAQQQSEETQQTISRLQLENKILRDAVDTTWQRIRQTCSCC